MPRLVVPIWLLPRRFSSAPSSTLWYGMMTWASQLILRRSQLMPSASSSAISFTSTPGSTTTPLPMTGTAFSYMTPELRVAVDHGVPGVVSALEAHDVVEVAGDQVCDLALTFVAPLGADENCRWHRIPFRSQLRMPTF